MSALPPEVVECIEACEGRWSDKAERSRVELGLEWADVEAVACSSDWWKRQKDDEETAIDGWKDSATGQDTHGRKLYMTGKAVYYGEETCWLVFTIHEHRKEKFQRPKRRHARP